MKKIYLIIIAFLFISYIGAQENVYKHQLKEYQSYNQPNKPIINSTTKNVIYSNTFDNVSDWVLAHDPNDCSLDWQIGQGLACTGSYPISTIVSTSSADGYAMLDSDSYGGATGGTEIEDSWMTMANPLNFNGYTNLVVEFETNYRRYNFETPYIVVGIGDGNGNVTWPDLDPGTDISMMSNVFHAFPSWVDGSGGGNVGDATLNPELIQVNISPALVGLDTVQLSDIYIRFNWTGTWGYAWFVDDFKIVEQPDNDLQTSSGYIFETNKQGVEYGRTPISQLNSNFTVGGSVFNFGALDQTNVSFVADFNGPSNFTSSSSIALIENDSTVNFENNEILSLQVGLYSGTFTVSSDADTSGGATSNNNLFERSFEITNDVYSIDGIGNHPTGYEDLGSIGTGSWLDPGNADNFICANMYHIEQTDVLNSVRVLLSQSGTGSNPGAEISLVIYDSITFLTDPFDPQNAIYRSDIYTLTSNDVTNGYFEIPVIYNNGWDPLTNTNTWEHLTLTAGNYYVGVDLVSYANTFDIRILNDETVPQPYYSSMIYLPVDANVYSNGNAFAIRMNMGANVAINENVINKVSIYPNPTSDVLNISTNSNDLSELTVKDISGKIVLSQKFNTKVTISTENYSKGVYIIDVKNNLGKISEKISVQ